MQVGRISQICFVPTEDKKLQDLQTKLANLEALSSHNPAQQRQLTELRHRVACTTALPSGPGPADPDPISTRSMPLAFAVMLQHEAKMKGQSGGVDDSVVAAGVAAARAKKSRSPSSSPERDRRRSPDRRRRDDDRSRSAGAASS